MEPLLIINPSPRKGKGRKMATYKKRSIAQKRATANLVALNRARRGSSRKHRIYAANPASRHAKHRSIDHAHHHYRKNPSARVGGIVSMFKPAFQGAVGAFGIDLVTGYVPMPLAIKVSPARHAIKGILAVGIGMLIKGNFGRNMAVGGLTVALHDAAKETVQLTMPGIQLGAEPTVNDLQGIGYYNPAPTGLGVYPSEPNYVDQGIYAHS